MFININCNRDDGLSIQDFISTLFNQDQLVYINKCNKFQYPDEDSSYSNSWPHLLMDCRRKVHSRIYEVSIVLDLLIKIVQEENFDLTKFTVDLNSEAMTSVNLYLQNKGYIPVISDKNTKNYSKRALTKVFYKNRVPVLEKASSYTFFEETLNNIFENNNTFYHSQRIKVNLFHQKFSNSDWTSEGLKKAFYDLIDLTIGVDSLIVNYEKINRLEQTHNNYPIVSQWGQNFLNQFNYENLHSFDIDDGTYACHHFATGAISNINSRSWRESNLVKNAFAHINSTLNFGPLSAITLADVSDFNFRDGTSINSLVKEKILNSSQTRIQGFSLPSYKKEFQSKPFYEILNNYTKKQSITRNGFFIPFLVPIKTFNQDLQIEIVYYYTFVLFDNYRDLLKRRVTKQTLSTFAEKYFINQGVYFYDTEKYYEELKQSFGSNAFKYSEQFLEILQKLNSEEIQRLKNENLSIRNYSYFDSTMNTLMTSSPKIDPSLEKNYKKFKTRFESINNSKRESLCSLTTKLNHCFYLQNKINNIKEYIRESYRKIDELVKEIETCKSEIYFSSNVIKNSSSAIINNKDRFKTISQDYQLAVKNAIEQNSFSTDAFFNSMAKDHIHLIEVSFKNVSTRTEHTFINDGGVKYSKLAAITSKLNENTINEITFLIDRPVRITVDGNPNKFIYGGPYIVKVNSGSILIKLAYPNSLFGYSSQDSRFLIHPHSSRQNFTSMIKREEWSRACLGEAQPLIYNAFKKNDLKLILLSAMTWVTSANSSDTWGAAYKYFPNSITSPSLVDIPNEEITEDDVQEFIENATNEEDVQTQTWINTDLEFAPENEFENVDETQQPPEIVEGQPTQDANPTPEQVDPPQYYVRYTTP